MEFPSQMAVDKKSHEDEEAVALLDKEKKVKVLQVVDTDEGVGQMRSMEAEGQDPMVPP